MQQTHCASLHRHTHLHVVPEEVASVFVFQFLAGQQKKNKIIRHAERAVLRHAGNLYRQTQSTEDQISSSLQSAIHSILQPGFICTLTYSHAIFDKYSAVLLPASLAEGVLTG